MKQGIFEITENRMIAKNTYFMVLKGDVSDITASGQFINIKLDGFFLRRPISVCDVSNDTVAIIYKVVGQGTEVMAKMSAGEKLDVLTGLGNGYDLTLSGDKPLLIGGGVGLPPMIGLCRQLLAEGKHPTVLAGFNNESEVFLRDAVEAMGAPFVLATMDGSAGVKGLVTDAMADLDFTDVCACGPLPMLKAIMNATDKPAQLSFEERMGCGFGACMGCTVKVKGGYKRICKDGPILDRDEVIW